MADWRVTSLKVLKVTRSMRCFVVRAQHAKDPQEAVAFLRLLEIASTGLDAPSAVSAHINTAAGFVKSEFLRDDYLLFDIS